MIIDDHVGELQEECADWKNAWGKVTKILDLPWDCSAAKVVEEVHKLQRKVADAHRLSSTVPSGDASWTALFERLAEIEKITSKNGATA